MSISELDAGGYRLHSLPRGEGPPGIEHPLLDSAEIDVPDVEPTRSAEVNGPLHRISAVRRQQGMSLRRISRQTRTNIHRLELEERENTDLPLSRLYWWQEVLEVPVADLLVDTDASLSAPVLERDRMVRIMKTAAAILEKADNPRVMRLAETLRSQLLEMMPELEGVAAWHSVGQRRTLDELGRIAEHTYPDDSWST
jgi:transcriptional regulator with XRE-family HTH domain